MSLLDNLITIFQAANQNPDKVKTALNYLQYFNYVATHDDVSVEDILQSIKRFQEQFGINEEGIGPKTIKAMEWPRCGVKERDVQAALGTVAKWGLPDITYYIRSRDSDLSPAIYDACLGKAFDFWSAVTPLKFHKVDSENQANIVADTGSSRADDFDGPSGVLAWFQLCPSPNFKGQLLGKFDLSETWVADSTKRGIILVNVACHEFGHALGLEHSNVSSALMAPFYSPNVDRPQQNDDIPRIQALYGKPVATPAPTPTPVPQPTPVPTPNPIPQPGTTTINITGSVTNISIPGYRVTKMG